jgi:hypothetical protein
VELVLDGDEVDEEPPMVDEEPEAPPELDESEPKPDELLPAPDVPELPRPDDDDEDPGRVDDEDPGKLDVVPGIELDDPGLVLEVDEPGMLELPEEDPEPDVPEAPEDPDMPLPEDPDMPLPEAPDDVSLPIEPPVVAPVDGLAEVPPIVELLPPAPVDCAIATPADMDRRTAIAVSFFIFHSSTCLSTFHLRAWTPEAVEISQSEGHLTRFGSLRHVSATLFMGAS